MIRSFVALSARISAALLVVAWAPDAHADANSYQAYLADHHVNTGLNSPARNLQAGFFACDALHAGQTPEQIAGSQPFAIVDIRGMIDAAQHELCPDTLH
jgi:hypothetical protein